MQSSAREVRTGQRLDSGRRYIGELRPLIVVQHLGVAWVAVNQFRDHPVPDLGRSVGLVGKGYLGAGLYFVAAGLLLSHLYSRASGQGRYDYPAFLRRTFAQLYPLQLGGTLSIVALVLLLGGFVIAAHQRVLFSDMTAHIGALQTVPAYLLGAGLYRLGSDNVLSPRWATTIVLAAAAWIVAAASLRLSGVVIWPSFGPLVFGAAALTPSANPFVLRDASEAGRRSLEIFVFCLPAEISYFRVLKLIFGPPSAPRRGLSWPVSSR